MEKRNFSSSVEKYFTSEHNERVKYYYAIFFLLYKILTVHVFHDFAKISDQFTKISEDSQKLSEGQLNYSHYFPMIFQDNIESLFTSDYN